MNTQIGVQDFLLGGGAIGGVLWAVYEKWMRHKSESASVSSDVAMFSANETLFSMMTKRLEALEKEVQQLRDELTREREYTRKLVTMMTAQGMAAPLYDIRD